MGGMVRVRRKVFWRGDLVWCAQGKHHFSHSECLSPLGEVSGGMHISECMLAHVRHISECMLAHVRCTYRSACSHM